MLVQFPDLKDKNILVTGASRGIGREIALSLARQRARVILNFRSGKEEEAEILQAECERQGGRAFPLFFDLNDGDLIKERINGLIEQHGPISGLVNNAGISKDKLLLRLKEADISEILDINLKGTILLTSILARNFLKAEAVSIVNISSVVGLMGNTSQAVYAASKAGMIGFTKSVAKELASKNIRCNAICPGLIDTDMTQALDDKAKEAYLSNIPLRRWGQSFEVANLVAFLLSKFSSYITGEVIKIDGGLYI